MTSKTIKAASNSSARGKAVIVIAIFSILMLFSIVMAIYDISDGMRLFGILFGLAAVIFAVLLMLKINSVFGTYIKLQRGNLYMKSWVNDFLPYGTEGGFLSELTPSKTKLTEIPAEDISLILIGTKDFIKRNATSAGKKLVRALYPYEHSSKKSQKNLISSMDLFYVETIDDECCFMCIQGYEPKSVVDIIGELYKSNPPD